MEPLRVSPNKSFLAGYEENYYRVIFSLFGLAYLFSYYYKGPDMVPLKEFLIPRNIFAVLPFILIGLSYIIPYVRTHIKDIGSGFYLLCTLHLVGFFSTNNFNTHYEIGIITLVLFSNLHLNKVLYIVLYNVIVLTALEYVFITAVPTANIQPVLFFLFLLSVMLICIFYQLYRIRFNNQVNERDELLSGIISGNPEAWMIFEGPGLIAKDGSANALKMFQIKDTKELEQISLRTLIAAESVNDSDEIIRSIIAKPVFTIKTQCRKQSGELFWADVSSFRIPGRAGFIQCRFLDITENKNIQVNATENAIRYRSYLDNTGDGLIICDSYLNVVLVNKEAVSIFKSESTGNFSGKSLETLTGSEIVNQLTKGTSEIPNLEMDAFTSISVTDDTDKRYTFYIKKITDLISNNTEILIRVSTTEKKETPLESKSEVLPQQPITIIQDPGTTLLQSGIPSFIADGTGNIQEVNEPLILFLGYNQEELKSLHAENIIHPKDLTLFRNIFNNSKIATQKKHTDLRIIGKSGKTKFVQLYCSSHTIQAGEVIVLILLNDITSFKKAEEELVFAGSNVNAVIENTDAPIFSVDFNHRISVMNTAFSREIQKRTGVIPSIGSDYRDYLSTENKLTWNTLIPKIMRGEVMRLDEIISYQDGSVDYFEVSYYPITTSENAIIGVSVLAGKVTERIKFEKELIKSKETAEKATKAKSEFLSTMSHEIRTPLNGLLGMSELLNTTKLNGRQREFVDAIKLSGEALLTIINDVLDFSRIESEKLELQNKPFSLKKTIDETFDILYYKAIEQGNKLLVSLDPNIPEIISGDKARLRQIFVNLIGNAIKFTKNGTITVKAFKEKEVGDKLELKFAVQDTGLGMSQEQMDKLFQAFTQADPTTFNKFGGTGLGLAISAKLTGLMHGKIWVESKPGEGSTFYFTIVVEPSIEKDSSSLAEKNKIKPGTRILLLSDNEFTKSRIVSYAIDWKTEVRIAESIEESVKDLKEEKFHIILIDGASLHINYVQGAKILKDEMTGFESIPILGINKKEASQTTKSAAHYELFDLIIPDTPDSLLLSGIISDLTEERNATQSDSENPSELGRKIPLNILVAEDNQINQTLARISLQRLGYEPEIVNNGSEAVQRATEKDFHIIFMDVQMPVMDGLEATGKILQNKKSAKAPVIIAMTAFAMEGDKEKCLAAGMQDYVSKPIKIEDFRSIIFKWGARKTTNETGQVLTSENQIPDSDDLIDLKLFERLKEMGSDDPGFMASLLKLYIKQSDESVSEIEALTDTTDYIAMGQAAHKLKGSSLNLGAKKLGELCRIIEVNSSQNNFKNIKSIVADLKKIYQLSVKKLTELISST